MPEHEVEKDARLLLRIEYAVYANAEGVDNDERASVMAAIRDVLVSERVITPETRHGDDCPGVGFRGDEDHGCLGCADASSSPGEPT